MQGSISGAWVRRGVTHIGSRRERLHTTSRLRRPPTNDSVKIKMEGLTEKAQSAKNGQNRSAFMSTDLEGDNSTCISEHPIVVTAMQSTAEIVPMSGLEEESGLDEDSAEEDIADQADLCTVDATHSPIAERRVEIMIEKNVTTAVEEFSMEDGQQEASTWAKFTQGEEICSHRHRCLEASVLNSSPVRQLLTKM